MSQLAASEGQPRFSGGGAGLFLRRLETVKSQEECWQERYDGRLSRTDLWGRGGEIPLRYPTQYLADIWFLANYFSEDSLSNSSCTKDLRLQTYFFIAFIGFY